MVLEATEVPFAIVAAAVFKLLRTYKSPVVMVILV
jgi:hypothetical protein